MDLEEEGMTHERTEKSNNNKKGKVACLREKGEYKIQSPVFGFPYNDDT